MMFWRQHWRSLSGALIGVALVSLLYTVGLLQPIEHFAGWIVLPVQTLTYSVINHLHPLYSPNEQTVIAENSTLKTQLAQSVAQVSQLQEQLKQYEDYKNQLDFAQQRNLTLLPAKIISRVGQGTSLQLIELNRGSNAGIQLGQPVLYNNGGLIGVVVTVTDSTARVGLITNPAIKLQAQTQTTSQTQGLITGQYGTAVVMDYILKDKPVALADVVVTSGRDPQIPPGLVIGTITSIHDEASALFKSADIAPLLSYDTASIVSVVTAF